MQYKIYRGLKKPLLLFGLKDRFIYQALGAGAIGLLLAVLLSTLFGILGMLLGLALGAGLIALVYKRQDSHGLYPKTRSKNTLYVFSPTLTRQNP